MFGCELFKEKARENNICQTVVEASFFRVKLKLNYTSYGFYRLTSLCKWVIKNALCARQKKEKGSTSLHLYSRSVSYSKGENCGPKLHLK